MGRGGGGVSRIVHIKNHSNVCNQNPSKFRSLQVCLSHDFFSSKNTRVKWVRRLKSRKKRQIQKIAFGFLHGINPYTGFRYFCWSSWLKEGNTSFFGVPFFFFIISFYIDPFEWCCSNKLVYQNSLSIIIKFWDLKNIMFFLIFMYVVSREESKCWLVFERTTPLFFSEHKTLQWFRWNPVLTWNWRFLKASLVPLRRWYQAGAWGPERMSAGAYRSNHPHHQGKKRQRLRLMAY